MAGGISSCHSSDGAVPTALSRHPEAVGGLTSVLPYRKILWVLESVWCVVKLLHYEYTGVVLFCSEFCPERGSMNLGASRAKVLG